MKFQLIFYGEALKNHEINPRDLSIALLAIDDILKEANQNINSGRAKAKIKVNASFETGSFKINFVLSVYDQIKDLFNSSGINALSNAKDIFDLIFGFGARSLVELIKFLKGGRAESIYENEDGSLTIKKDGKSLKTEKKIYELYKIYKLRKAFEDLVKPLKCEGIESVAIKPYDEKEKFNIIATKEELSYFDCPESEDKKIDKEAKFETCLSIINLSFKEGNKWYVNDGLSSFYVTVEDDAFLQGIDQNRIAFAKGDILRVLIRREQYYNENENKLKTENFIERVLKHENPLKQLNLE